MSSLQSFFDDPNGSKVVDNAAQQIAAPLVRGDDVVPDEVMAAGGVGVRVTYIILDGSPSMGSVADMLRDDFNEQFIVALKEARGDDTTVLRIGGCMFNEKIHPIWSRKDTDTGEELWFHKLEDLPILTNSEYHTNGGATALNKAIIDGTATALTFAANQKQFIGSDPDVEVLLLSDGANNCDPRDPSSVRQVITGANKNRVRFSFFYFETTWGLDNPEEYAREMGFDPENVQVFAKKDNETDEERRHRFRVMMRVLSRVSASRGTSATKATAAIMATAVDDDDDLV